MCYHNYTQHNGCGHIGEAHTLPWSLCAEAEQRLIELRGPMSPPLSPPASTFPPPKRSATSASSSKLGRRFASLTTSLSRSATTTSTSSTPGQRTVSGPASSRASTSSYMSSIAVADIPDHQLAAVKCEAPTRKTNVSSGAEMNVCKECKRWVREMRFMIERYEKTGSVKGTKAFEEFLRFKGEDDADGLYR